MKSPAPRIPTTPQIEADRAREERLLEIEEEQFAVLDRLRNAILACKTVADIHRFMMKCREVYAAGTMSTRTINRCRTWVKQRVEEIPHPPVTGTTGASGAGPRE